MGQINSREIVLLGTTTVTTNGSGPDINVIQGWQSATIMWNTTAASGTLPVINMFIQRKLGQAASTDLAGSSPTGVAIYDDLVMDTSNTVQVRIGSVSTHAAMFSNNVTIFSAPADWLNSNLALTANNLRLGPLGGIWRVAWTVTGTTPQFTIAVSAQLIPWAT